MESISQKPVEGGMAKVYPTGIVGYQPNGCSHREYAEAMKPLSNITPQNGGILISRHFG